MYLCTVIKILWRKHLKKSIMGKAEIDMLIKTLEIQIETYVRLSSPAIRNDKRYKEKLERMRMQLAILYAERENMKH